MYIVCNFLDFVLLLWNLLQSHFTAIDKYYSDAMEFQLRWRYDLPSAFSVTVEIDGGKDGQKLFSDLVAVSGCDKLPQVTLSFRRNRNVKITFKCYFIF